MNIAEVIDLRSDTQTRPSAAMREVMARAEVGDDVYGEDPSVLRLEEHIAGLCQKEAALFVPTGTMGNQLALLTQTQRGDEIVVGEGAHCAWFESGAASFLSGVQCQFAGKGGLFTAQDCLPWMKAGGLYEGRTSLIAVENSHNRAGGRVFPQSDILAIAALAKQHRVAFHLDGARICNTQVATGLPLAELVAPFDSLSICFSKGLGAPVGSALVGSSEVITRARRFRKMLGGGMRQVGILAAAAHFALENNWQRLREDHENAKEMAEALQQLPGVNVVPVETNIVVVELADGVDENKVVEAGKKAGVLFHAWGKHRLRLVFHLDVSNQATKEAASRLARVFEAMGRKLIMNWGNVWRRSLVAVVMVVGTCGAATMGCGGRSHPYLEARYAGDRAKTAGRYDEAAKRYREAALAAKSTHDRDEGLFLEAATLQQAGKTKEAIQAYDALAKLSPDGERSPRAAFDSALLRIRSGEGESAWLELERVLLKYQEHGSSRKAFRKLLQHKEEKAKGSALTWLDAHLDQLSRGLGEDARYRRAHLLKDQNRLQDARNAFVDVAKRYPYPQGSLTDDAWWNASLLAEELGTYQQAIADLKQLLSTREPATFGTSYERPRYSPAQFRMAELYLNRLHQPDAARRELHRLYTDFKTSILRDDALWLEAQIARTQGDNKTACSLIRTLQKEFPKSRFSGCSDKVCAEVPPLKEAPSCRSYIVEHMVKSER
jgi:threonine aldolase